MSSSADLDGLGDSAEWPEQLAVDESGEVHAVVALDLAENLAVWLEERGDAAVTPTEAMYAGGPSAGGMERQMGRRFLS